MTDAVRADMAQGDTERNSLLEMVADHLAASWLKLRYPAPYRSVRYVQGYMIEIAVREFRRVEPGRDEDDSISD